MFRKLFTPIRINKLEIKNRICMPAFGLAYTDPDRKPSQRLLDFYRARAQGGCGLLIVGGVGIDRAGSGVMMPGIERDELIADWRHFADVMHEHGARLFLQLFHAGRYQHSALADGQQPVAPSAIRSRYTNEEPRALLKREVEEIEDKFAAAALRAKKAGVDGVEFIGSAGYLISQFTSPVTNQREDEYGGSLENRTRFGRRVVERARDAVGPDYPLIMRVAGNEFMPGGNTSRDMLDVVQVFAEAGLDAIDVTGGWHETRVPQLPSTVPRGAFSYLAAGIRKVVSVPVMASNRIVEPRQAERILRDEVADMVNIGRAHIADPDWANKAQRGELDQIRPCVDCLQGCMEMLFSGMPVQCLCNAQAGFEGERKVQPADEPKSVVVIGAGPAGLEAAVTAARRGHRVRLFEEAQSVGGQLALVAAPPGREEFAHLLRYYETQVKHPGVELKLGQKPTVQAIKDCHPDVVILATGSRQLIPQMPGVDRPEVATAWDALLDRVDLGRTVAVLGGGAVGIETAIQIADAGTVSGDALKFLFKHEAEDAQTLKQLATAGTREVTLIEAMDKVGSDIGRANRWVFLKELRMLGVKIITGAMVTAITDEGVMYQKDGEERCCSVQSVVLALGAVPNVELGVELEEAGIEYLKIGDAQAPRKIIHAVHEGFLAALGV